MLRVRVRVRMLRGWVRVRVRRVAVVVATGGQRRRLWKRRLWKRRLWKRRQWKRRLWKRRLWKHRLWKRRPWKRVIGAIVRWRCHRRVRRGHPTAEKRGSTGTAGCHHRSRNYERLDGKDLHGGGEVEMVEWSLLLLLLCQGRSKLENEEVRKLLPEAVREKNHNRLLSSFLFGGRKKSKKACASSATKNKMNKVSRTNDTQPHIGRIVR